MSLTEEDVRRVATLARLELSVEETQKFRGQLSSIIDYIGQLNELDTNDVEPTSHALDLKNAFREDVCERKFDKESWKSNAPQTGHGHFRVPRVIEE